MNRSIVCDERICSGAPCVGGTRLTVYNVVSLLIVENSLANVMEQYELSQQQVHDAINYCSSLQCINDISLDVTRKKYCANCVLRGLEEVIHDQSALRQLLQSTKDPMALESVVAHERLEKADSWGWKLSEELLERI
jgi:uncharacterized protein (DUF433 family)